MDRWGDIVLNEENDSQELIEKVQNVLRDVIEFEVYARKSIETDGIVSGDKEELPRAIYAGREVGIFFGKNMDGVISCISLRFRSNDDYPIEEKMQELTEKLLVEFKGEFHG